MSKADAGKDKNADKLAGIISSIASSETKSPNSSMPPPKLLEEFARIDTTMPEFFQREYVKQMNHERRLEKSFATRHFILRLMDYSLPLLCIIALAITVFYGDNLAEKIVLSFIIVTIYILRVMRNHIAQTLNKKKLKKQ